MWIGGYLSKVFIKKKLFLEWLLFLQMYYHFGLFAN